ncbi:helix-turn-helix domain-containing protein [Phenylobacterium sp.]|uniref:helix-turn-helix domain-containing protein n=1 Tax=Phenylobacterium sp. TaxID=1871053 RepID=UPI003BAC3F28
MTTTCMECGKDNYEELILPERLEDVGGIEVNLINTVRVRRCPGCGDELTMIPEMQNLVRTVALVRVLLPLRLGNGDIKLMRRALDMTQKEFAEAMEVTPETISRWESGAQGVGGYSEKLVRHNVGALLADGLPAIDYDPATIARMHVRDLKPGETMPRIDMEYALVKHDGERSRAWDGQPQCMAA